MTPGPPKGRPAIETIAQRGRAAERIPDRAWGCAPALLIQIAFSAPGCHWLRGGF
jgi:hypothetical protein